MSLVPCIRYLAPAVALSFALCVLSPAAHVQAQAKPDTAASEAAPAEPSAAEPAPDPASEDAPRISPLVAHQQEVLRKSLSEADRERAETSTLLPWLLVGAGTALLLVGVIAGAGATLGCGDTCKGSAGWPPWMLIGGGTAATVGVIWLQGTKRDIASIESRQYRIRTELERIEWHNSPLPQASLGTSLSLRASF